MAGAFPNDRSPVQAAAVWIMTAFAAASCLNSFPCDFSALATLSSTRLLNTCLKTDDPEDR